MLPVAADNEGVFSLQVWVEQEGMKREHEGGMVGCCTFTGLTAYGCL